MSLASYIDFISSELDHSQICKQEMDVLNSCFPEDYFQLSPNEIMTPVSSHSHSRKSSSSSVSTISSNSLINMKQVQSTTFGVCQFLLPTPKEPKSVFRQILFDDFDDEDNSINPVDYWNDLFPTNFHPDFSPIDESKSENVETATPPKNHSIKSEPPSSPRCPSPKSVIGLGIHFGSDDSSLLGYPKQEQDSKSLMVTLKTTKNVFYKTVAERRKNNSKRKSIEINKYLSDLDEDESDDNDDHKKIKHTPVKNNVAILPRTPASRQAKQRALDKLQDHDLYSPPSPPHAQRGKPQQSQRGRSVTSGDGYCKYKYNNRLDVFQCLNCGSSFKRLEHLKRHSRSIHSEIRPYKCHMCDKAFARSDNLAQHLKVHQRLMLTRCKKTKSKFKKIKSKTYR